MKTLIDDTLVIERGYYFLLDFVEYDEEETIFKLFGVNRLCELEKYQYLELLEIAFKTDLKYMWNNN